MQKKKVICKILVILFFLLMISNVVFADDNFKFDSFDDKGNGAVDGMAEDFMGTGITVIKTVGYAMSIIMLSYIGIKYMISAPNEKADMKKSLIIYFVGACLVFGATQLFATIADFATNNI